MFDSIDELKLNRFKPCRCIKPKDLFSRFGQRAVPVFPSSDEVIPMNMNKLESLEYLENYDAQQAELDRLNQTVNDSSVNQHLKNDDSSGES